MLVLQNSEGNFGHFVWPSALVLAELLQHIREQIRGRCVLELGAGVALPGLLAAKLGASKVRVSFQNRFRPFHESTVCFPLLDGPEYRTDESLSADISPRNLQIYRAMRCCSRFLNYIGDVVV